MWWDRIISWFTEMGERRKCLSEFNKAASDAFILGIVPVFMKAEVSKGNRDFKHMNSNLLFSGFRIRTVSGTMFTNSQVEAVGLTICSNAELMRKLVTLGFDTLEIVSSSGTIVKAWPIVGTLQLQ